jgi:hypothetical protein
MQALLARQRGGSKEFGLIFGSAYAADPIDPLMKDRNGATGTASSDGAKGRKVCASDASIRFRKIPQSRPCWPPTLSLV